MQERAKGAQKKQKLECSCLVGIVKGSNALIQHLEEYQPKNQTVCPECISGVFTIRTESKYDKCLVILLVILDQHHPTYPSYPSLYKIIKVTPEIPHEDPFAFVLNVLLPKVMYLIV